MEETSVILKGIEITILGIGIVFIFLLFLIFAMKIMSKCVMYLDKRFPGETGAVQKNNSLIAAAIAAAKNFSK